MKLIPTMEVGDSVELKNGLVATINAIRDATFTIDRFYWYGMHRFTWSDSLQRWVER